jgi:hypothetical protein
MSNWRDVILSDFVPNVSKLTLVADPDSLLTEEKLAQELRERGFDLIEFNDPIEFRYAYESQYRAIWDKGEHTDLVVVLRLQNAEMESLPYDLLQAGRKLSFNLGGLFPNLSYPIIEKIDRCLLDALYEAQFKSPPDCMGDNATKDFILRHVFRIAAELITNDVELLKALIQLHYGKMQMPVTLAERFIFVLRVNDNFKSWPLDEIVIDDKAFFSFLQERWPVFLSNLDNVNQITEESLERDLRYPGPDYLPFDHQDIKVYIDNLFVEGKLNRVQVSDIRIDADSWIRSGIMPADVNDEDFRINRLFDMVDEELPTTESRYFDWTTFALKWADLTSLVHNENNVVHQARLTKIGEKVNEAFREWLKNHYSSLINLSPSTPAMVHHIPRRLSREREITGNSHIALIVVDGLALDQWVTVRQILQKQDASLIMRESSIFAWIPTLTSVSRQSIFSGKPPFYFPLSINSTNSEEKLWKQFWDDSDVNRLNVVYKRGLGDGDVSNVLNDIDPHQTKVIGLVVDKVDKIMHGMQLGSSGMHNQIKQWCQGGFLCTLVENLLDLGYEVWLTSDHGNIECIGKGRPSEGVIAEIRGERTRIYSTPELRSNITELFTFAHEWNPIGLPPGYFPLVVSSRDAFANHGDSLVGHGGISIEEVIVPFVKIEKRAQ